MWQSKQDSNDFMNYYNSINDGPMKIYGQKLLNKELRKDNRQEMTLQILQELYQRLNKLNFQTIKRSQKKSKAPSDWFSYGGQQSARGSDSESTPLPTPEVKGVYMYGGVGCGKTMLMDLFYDACKAKSPKVRRTHFNDFMIEVHETSRQFQRTQDPLMGVAEVIIKQHTVICLDEFFVTDVADAMIIHRLFYHLWSNGLVVLGTSNRKPDNLYEGGLNRQQFLPFIESLKSQCVEHNLDSPVDYRRLTKMRSGEYIIAKTQKEGFDELMTVMSYITDGEEASTDTCEVSMGRQFQVVRSFKKSGACFFTFDEVCTEAYGAADYIAIASKYDTIAICNIPCFTKDSKDQAARFVTLVDVLYDHKVRLLCSAENKPLEIFKNVFSFSKASHEYRLDDDRLLIDNNISFSKDRTVSRLIEMQSQEYGEHHSKGRPK